MFNDLCPIMLRFSNRPPMKFTLPELLAYKALKKRFLKRQETVLSHYLRLLLVETYFGMQHLDGVPKVKNDSCFE